MLTHPHPNQVSLLAFTAEHNFPPDIPFDVEYIYGFVWWGVCKQSRWRHSV